MHQYRTRDSVKAMKGLGMFCLVFSMFSASFLLEIVGAEAEKIGVYIIYMGAAKSTDGSFKNDQAQLMNSLLKRRKNSVVQNYRHGISGFAARLSAAEAQAIAQKPGVVSVFPDPVFQLHTTRSWDFLKYETDIKIDSKPNSDSASSSSGSDSIIGILDTGIWPESESFSDKDMGPIPSRWKGTCMTGPDFNSSNCNRKLIGARFYTSDDDDGDSQIKSPRDNRGHGTHVASTAAGTAVPNASYYGVAEGTAKGGSTSSRIAMYKVCSLYGCRGSDILAAFDDAIADGVDILSLSLGAPSYLVPDLKEDPISIGAFHAVQNGIMVICSAGNDGPSLGTVVNSAPWILTVAASTIDRYFESDVVLGGNKVIKGQAINFANLGTSPVHPLIYAKSAKKENASEVLARNCDEYSMDADKINGKIVLCDDGDDEVSTLDKKNGVQNLGGIGLILSLDETSSIASNYKDFPMTEISSKDAQEIISYINSTKNPVATILPTADITNYKPAPTIASFSARGPSSITKNILKPDIAAPGVSILAAWLGNDTDLAPKGEEPPQFYLLSGTSMACPHVSGMAGVVKSLHPSWSPSTVKSAIMTTASQINNMKNLITTDSGDLAGAYDYGAGEISTTGPQQPGLVYETTIVDYMNFLCYYGYNISTIQLISKTVPEDFACPKESSTDMISNINYPSISVANLMKETRNIGRTLTNVGGDGDITYTLTVEAPDGLHVTVTPDKLQFTKNGEKQTYQVSFHAPSSLNKDVLGSITWTSGKFKVRSPFVVSSNADTLFK